MSTLKSLKRGLLVGLVLLSINQASASLLIEPHLGYNISGKGDQGSVEYDYNGTQYGLRLGYQNLGFMVGLDYTLSSFELEKNASGTITKDDVDRKEIGVFAGYNFPILLRAWAAYYFSNTTEYSNGSELDGNTKELGLGFTGFPFLSINLMYRMVIYDEFKSISSSSSLKPSIDAKEIVLGISLPFTL